MKNMGNMKAVTVQKKGEDIFNCIELYLHANRLESQYMNSEDMLHIRNLIHDIRSDAEYKILLDWPIGHGQNIIEGFSVLCDNVLFDHGNPYKLCYRALTLFIFANDLCKNRLKDNDVKEKVMTIAKRTINFYHVDWSLIIEKRLKKWDIVKFICVNLTLFAVAVYMKYMIM